MKIQQGLLLYSYCDTISDNNSQLVAVTFENTGSYMYAAPSSKQSSVTLNSVESTVIGRSKEDCSISNKPSDSSDHMPMEGIS